MGRNYEDWLKDSNVPVVAGVTLEPPVFVGQDTAPS